MKSDGLASTVCDLVLITGGSESVSGELDAALIPGDTPFHDEGSED